MSSILDSYHKVDLEGKPVSPAPKKGKKPKNLRGSDSARRYGKEPKVHLARDAYPGDESSWCGRTVHGTRTDDKVTCSFCLRGPR